MADERAPQGEQGKEDRGRRAFLSRGRLRSESFRAGDHENLDHFLWSGFGRMGLPDVLALLLGDRRSWPPEGFPAFCSGRQQRSFHLHVRKHRAVAPVGRHLSKSLVGTAGHLEPLLGAVVVLVVEWLMLFWMYRNKILIKA